VALLDCAGCGISELSPKQNECQVSRAHPPKFSNICFFAFRRLRQECSKFFSGCRNIFTPKRRRYNITPTPFSFVHNPPASCAICNSIFSVNSCRHFIQFLSFVVCLR
jgi:hypothetical protein